MKRIENSMVRNLHDDHYFDLPDSTAEPVDVIVEPKRADDKAEVEMQKTKIDWVINPDGSKGNTWNPAIGCEGNCPYCYARRIAKRFNWNWTPHWEEKKFQTAFPKKPTRIFVGSMTDIAYWKPEWMERVLAKIREYPQHTFYFLTKKSKVYSKYNLPKQSKFVRLK